MNRTPEQLRGDAVLRQKFARQHREHDDRHARAYEGRDHVERLHQGGSKDVYARARAAVDAWLEATGFVYVDPHPAERIASYVEGAPTKPMRAVAVIGGPDTKARVLTDAIAKEDEA
jgi:hypothetical protein